MRSSFMQALPIVAKALSENYGVTLGIFGNQAQASKDRIILPVLPEDDARAKILARGYLDHEAGHVKCSDYDDNPNQSGFEKNLTNILEDIRIEQAMARSYPGCRQNLDALTKLLAGEGDFRALDPMAPPAAVIQGYLLHLLRARILHQQVFEPMMQQDVLIFDQAFPGLRAKLEPIALEVKDAPSTQAVRELVRRIMVLLQDLAQPSPPQQPDSSGNDQKEPLSEAKQEASGRQEQEDSSSQSSKDQSDSLSGDGQREASSEDQDDSSASQTDTENSPSESGQASPSNQDDEPLPTDRDGGASNSRSSQPDGTPGDLSDGQANTDTTQSGDKVAGDDTSSSRGLAGSSAAAEALADNSDYQDLGQTLANKLDAISRKEGGSEMAVDIPAWWNNSRPIEEKLLLQATARLRAMLSGVVQSKRARRDRSSRYGTRLNLAALHRMSVHDDRVFLSQQERRGINTAVYLLMDQSYSMKMNQKFEVAFMATAALAKALSTIPGTAVSAGAFSTEFVPGYAEKRNYLASLLKFEETACRMKLIVPPPVGGTPMAEALFCAAAHLFMRKEPRRLLVVLTDGEPNDIGATQEIIDKCRSVGMEVYGVGIMDNRVIPVFGKQFSTVVNTIGELPERMFRLLANCL